MNDYLTNLSFEQALLALEETVARLESGDLSLEESLELFEKGQALAGYCSDLLEKAELRVEMLTADGEIKEISAAQDGAA